jgi:hypothetical protein
MHEAMGPAEEERVPQENGMSPNLTIRTDVRFTPLQSST